MKIIITENQMEKFLFKYFNKIIEDSEFEWIDEIDVNKTTTIGGGGWGREYVKPLYLYSVYIKSEYSVKGSDKDKIINEVSKMHSMLFSKTDSGPEAYYSVKFIPE